MAQSAGKVLEGVFAVNKPPSISSAQVLRDLQNAFRTSETFAPLLKQTDAQDAQNRQRAKRRKIDNDNAFKMGHGGTLDPMATGVLIVGIGRGTKSLQSFLDCTKTYETVVLFGKSTATYDVAGKVVASADTSKIDRRLVEDKLSAFRGDIKQVPPIYSALKINGIKAYDYARSGKELPRELAARDMKVSECVLLDWYEAGQHDFRWPAEEAPQAEKDVLSKLTNKTKGTSGQESDVEPLHKNVGGEKENSNADHQAQRAVLDTPRDADNTHAHARKEKASMHTHTITGLSELPANAPAARIKLTVSSGFYVRSFAHDLGIACGSYGTMAELARTRQGAYTAVQSEDAEFFPAVEYADLGRGEAAWSPRITEVLSAWLAQNPAEQNTASRNNNSSAQTFRHKNDGQNFHKNRSKRRNSSSPE
ncbi:pseudouridine synthase pus4 [Lithohypha guttulata]|nr:pseudouridine synthase pus4 [Lithohypha guttulata]